MAEKRNINGVTLNDGNGLMDHDGLIDSLIIDCNNAVKQIVSGSYVTWCGTMLIMAKKLNELKIGINNDAKDMRDRITALEKMNSDLNNQMFEKEKQ
jgi:hypothetical protein